MDNRNEIKPGDFFNLTREAGENEVWNNQNRFDTCQLKAITAKGEWEFVEYWDQYSKGDYPFLSNTIYWNPCDPSNEYAQKCLIEKITDPEVDGFKDKKAYLPGKIKSMKNELYRKYHEACLRIVISTIKTKKLDDSSLEPMRRKLKEYGVILPSGIFAWDGKTGMYTNKVPFITAVIDGKKWCVKPYYILPDKKVFVCEGVEIPFDIVTPNDELYPIDFALEYPWSSVFQKAEYESLAARILYFTESWDKPLTWEEYYETMTLNDKSVSYAVKRDFDRVAPFLKSPETCAAFSKSWAALMPE